MAKGWESGTVRDPRSWFNHHPVFGSFGVMAIIYPSEFDVETLGPRVAGVIARDVADWYQRSAYQDGWLR